MVLDLAILTKKSSAGRIQRTSAGVVERRTIRDAIKPLSFVTHFHFAVSYRLATYDLRKRNPQSRLSQQDFARHPSTYIVDVQADPKTAQHPVKNFPILAGLS